jgi:3-methyladenine DNA glycosylase AlkD
VIHTHKAALASMREPELERLGKGMDGWGPVDGFAAYIAGVAWREGQISDEVVHRWARSPDRWWRRAALVCTVALNTRARGGRGDTDRTLAVCGLLVDDRDDMVVKAMSWALRELVFWDREAVEGFLAEHDQRLAARARRETRNKLETGLKNPGRGKRLGGGSG